MCVREGGQPWVSVLTFHLAWGGLFTRGPLCPPPISLLELLSQAFNWVLGSQIQVLEFAQQVLLPWVKSPAPRHRFDAFSIVGELSGGSAVSLQSQSHWTQSHLRDGPAPSLHLTEAENKTVQSCKRPVTKAGPHNLHVSKVAYGLKRATQPWRFWSAYGHDGTNRNLSDYDLHNSELMILSCFYTGLKLRKWKYAKSHWKEEKTLKATGTCWILQAPGTEKAVAALGTSYHCDNNLRRRAHPGQPRRKGVFWLTRSHTPLLWEGGAWGVQELEAGSHGTQSAERWMLLLSLSVLLSLGPQCMVVTHI